MLIMEKDISEKIVMIGVFAGKNAPGGMASVIKSYRPYINKLRYITSWKDTNKFFKLFIAIKAYIILFFILVFDKKIEIIHFHTAEANSFWRKSKLLNLSKKFNKKTIMHIHAATFKDFYSESTPEVKGKILKILNKNDRLIVLSNSWKKWFEGIGINNEKIIVLNNIVDEPKLIDTKKTDGKLHVLFLGELKERKGIFDILETLIKNKSFFDNKIELKIGGNKNEDKIKNIIRDNNLENIVSFEGWVSGQKKIDYLNWADVYILPSYNEGLPIGILEALSYNCAIISSPVGGIPDIISNEKNGLLVEPGNKNEIFTALSRLIENKTLLEKLQHCNKQLIANYYPNSVIKHLEKIYTDLL